MTKILFFRRDGIFYGFEETGHTGYGESGDDVLCAALSAMTMLIVNTVEISYAGDIDYKIDCGSPQTYEVYKLNMQHAQLKKEEEYGNINKKDK